MRKRLYTGLFVFAGMVSAPATTTLHTLRQAPAHQADPYHRDPRLKALRSFFRRSDCPALQYAPVFLQAADDYNLDWRLLPSISFVESTGGKAAPNNNLFGWDSGQARFTSPEAGIHVVGYRLAYSGLYRDKGLDAILATYNPDTQYATKVKSVMRSIAPSAN
jgi:hypothetical protein